MSHTKGRMFTNPGRRGGRAMTYRRLFIAALAAAFWAAPGPAAAATEIQWWHAMAGELGRQLELLATKFNASQSEYQVIPAYKGSYNETMTAAIFGFRSRAQPAIVQVN